MTTFFGVGANPFSTPVGQRIEQATDPSLASENWALNMEICDIINESEDGPRDAIKSLRKRLQQNAGKNYIVVMYTLTVLETCVKNCGRRFHVLVCNKEFIQELVKLIGPKNDPPTAVQEKVLSLIQSWADAFRSLPELAGVVQVYQDLKLKGIEFPMTDLDAMAPIHTPQRSIPDGEVSVAMPALMAQKQGLLGRQPSPVPELSAESRCLSPDQLAKLHGELDVVQGNMAVLSEMLSELTPGKEHPSDIELLKELHATLKIMQQRLVELISKLANEEITEDFLRVNDLLNNIFLRYGRFENNRQVSGRGRDALGAAEGAQSLIDLNDEPTPLATPFLPSSQMSALSLKGAAGENVTDSRPDKEDSEFDMFAQSRNVTYESSKNGGSSSFEANLQPDQVSGGLGVLAQARTQTAMHKESDFDEMAAWLGNEAVPQESLTSSEFERFLAERAAAADGVPSTVASPSSSSTQRQRRAKKEPEEASLYAL